MREIPPKELSADGRIMLFYGPTDVGKTLSILISMPKPGLWIPLERKDMRKNYDLAVELGKLNEEDITIGLYDTWQETMDYVIDLKGKKRFSAIFVDGLTHLMAVDLLQEIENQSIAGMKKGDAKLMEKIRDKPMAYITKGGIENYGTLNSATTRLMAVMQQLVEDGTCIIFSALITENPKWNMELQAAPLISGKVFSDSFPLFFGTIGMVVSIRDKKTGKLEYPPGVMLRCPDGSEGSFLARFTGRPGSTGRARLDVKKIMEL